MNTYPFYFKVKIYFDDNYYTQSGMGLANSFAEAAKQIEETFAEDLISIEHLEMLEDGNLIFMPDDICWKIANDDTFGDLVKIKEEDE